MTNCCSRPGPLTTSDTVNIILADFVRIVLVVLAGGLGTGKTATKVDPLVTIGNE